MATHQDVAHNWAHKTGRELVYPGAYMTRAQAKKWGDRNINPALKRAFVRAFLGI